jgi:DNA-binding LytR/AlgR family response regulator
MDPITWAAVRRSLLISGAIGVFLSFVGAFGSSGMPFLIRTPFMVGLSWVGAAMGIVAFRLAVRMRWTRGNRLLQGAVAALMMTLPMGMVVWAASHAIAGAEAPLRAIPNYLGVTFVMCQAMTLFVVFMNMRSSQATAAHAALAPPQPKFLERLPLKLRGAEVWAVEAEDHYLRLHTSKGQDLILLRLADAVDELAGIEGAQVHRSWWVARDAIADARRGDGRATLVLKDGSEVPVSRTYAKIIRDLGWI